MFHRKRNEYIVEGLPRINEEKSSWSERGGNKVASGVASSFCSHVASNEAAYGVDDPASGMKKQF